LAAALGKTGRDGLWFLFRIEKLSLAMVKKYA
jgi:hypothetical protein